MLSLLLRIALVRCVAGVRVEEAAEAESAGGPAKALALAALLAPAEGMVLDRSALGRAQPGSVAPSTYAPLRPERLRGLLRLQGGEAEDADANVPEGMKVVCDGNECQLVPEDEAPLDLESGGASVVVPTQVSPADLEAGRQGVAAEAEEVKSATLGEKVHECWDGTKSWLCWLRGAVFPGNPPRKRGPPPVQDFRAGQQAPSGRQRGPSAVKTVRSAKEFQQLVSNAPARQLVVVDFFATWCGPCKEIAPKYEQMARDMKHVLFLKVDVDANKDLAQQYGVKSMPTFKLLRKARVVDDLTGADAEGLRGKVESLAGKASRFAYAGAGRQL